MKTKNLFISIFFVITSIGSLNAQNWLLGGNTNSGPNGLTTTNNFLGSSTGNNVDLNFGTNGNNVMTLTTGQNVGIGLTAPNYLLDLDDGDLNLSDGIIRIGDEEMVLYDATSNNLGLGITHGLGNITTGGDNISVGFSAGLSLASGANNIFIGDESGDALDHGDRNIFIGNESGSTQTGANDNVYIGHNSGRLNLMGQNVFIGSGTGEVGANAANCVFVGFDAGNATTTGDDNVFIGNQAGLVNTTGNSNVFIGNLAGLDNTTGEGSVCIGEESGTNLTTGNQNTFLGIRSGRDCTTGRFNVAFGAGAGLDLTVGTCNNFVGVSTGFNMTEGDRNTINGYSSGLNLTGNLSNDNTILGALAGSDAGLTSGNRLTLLGAYAEASNRLTNATAVGFRASVTANNSLVLGGITGENGGTDTNVGIGTTAPANRLELVEGTTGESGLRLTSLANSTASTSSDYVLSVDYANGDVILVDADGVGNDDWHITGNGGTDDATNFIGTTDAQDFVVKTNDTEYMRVIGDATNRGNVGIHTTAPTAVLHVVDDASASSNTAIHGYVTDGDVSKGVEGLSELDNTSTTGYGGYFKAKDLAGTGPTTNYGVYAEAIGGGDNYGIYAKFSGTQTTTDCAGYFNGDVYSSTGVFGTSDRNLKSDIEDLEDGLGVINSLRPVTYRYNTDKFPHMNLQEGEAFGFIAQEVESVLPIAVREFVHPKEIDRNGVEHEKLRFKALNYIQVVPFLTKAIQEQQEMIEEKNERISKLELEVERLTQLKQDVERIKEQLAVLDTRMEQTEVIDVQVGVIGEPESGKTELHQNRPNPFRQVTTFAYALGKEGKVELNIYSMDGVFIDNVVNRFQEKGEHKVEWDSKEIPNGMYFYILNVDGVEWVKKAIRLR